ncbi:MAG: energy transducer TonB [Prevotella sp.]|nr:energy transducer TonB [Prevotella sp.]
MDKKRMYENQAKRSLLAFVFALICIMANPLSVSSILAMNSTYNNITDTVPKIYVTAEVMPSYPGGEEAMGKFIGENLQYPPAALEAGIQGRVTTRFVVTETGDISGAEVVRGIDPACDAEALRVINMMPKWTPGKQGGVAVSVYFSIPIMFRLSDTQAGNQDSVVIIYRGKEISLVELEAENQKQIFANMDKNISLVENPLTEAEAIGKYGEVYAGKKVIEVFYRVESKADAGEKKLLWEGQVLPSFPGGEDEMYKYIVNNTRYPAYAQINKIEGIVLVRVTVAKDGKLKDVTVAEGIDTRCDREAVRVVKSMPKWIPGTKDGEPVDTQYLIPIKFALDE